MAKEFSRLSRKIFMFVIMFVGAVGYMAAMGFARETLIDKWIPILISGAVALVSGAFLWKLWRNVTRSFKFWLNYLLHAVVLTGVLSGLFFTLNFCFADETTLHEETVVVASKYYKVRHKSKRISRRVYGQGEAYNEYYVDVRFDDGKTKDITIPFEQYRRIKVGTEIEFPVADGLFGIKVMKRNGRKVDVPESHHRQ